MAPPTQRRELVSVSVPVIGPNKRAKVRANGGKLRRCIAGGKEASSLTWPCGPGGSAFPTSISSQSACRADWMVNSSPIHHPQCSGGACLRRLPSANSSRRAQPTRYPHGPPRYSVGNHFFLVVVGKNGYLLDTRHQALTAQSGSNGGVESGAGRFLFCSFQAWIVVHCLEIFRGCVHLIE